MRSSNTEEMLQLQLLSQQTLPGSCGALPLPAIEKIVTALIFIGCLVACFSGLFLAPKYTLEDLCPNSTDALDMDFSNISDVSATIDPVEVAVELNPVITPIESSLTCEELVDNCQCRTFLFLTYECTPTCPAPALETTLTGSQKMPTQFWRYIAESVFDPFIYTMSDEWRREANFWTGIGLRYFVMIAASIITRFRKKVASCTICQQQAERVASMRCLTRHYAIALACCGYFMVLQALDLTSFIINFARRDIHSIQEFLFVTGGLPLWLGIIILLVLIIFLVFKIFFLYVLVVCCATYFRICSTARAVWNKLTRDTGKEDQAENQAQLLPPI